MSEKEDDINYQVMKFEDRATNYNTINYMHIVWPLGVLKSNNDNDIILSKIFQMVVRPALHSDLSCNVICCCTERRHT